MDREIQWLLQEKYDGVESAAFRADSARLAAGEPLAYVIGWAPFLTTRIYLDSKPLIPRPETEYWTEQAIRWLAGRAHEVRAPAVLDMCAGSGCSGVAIAHALPTAAVTFAEIDSAHLSTIQKNLAHNLNTRYTSHPAQYTVRASDLFATVEGTFDLIVTNPPYIDATLDRVDAAVQLHEPERALYGGPEGMAIITRLIADAAAFLRPGGQLWIEHEPEQTTAIATLATTHNLAAETHIDQYDVCRFTILSVAQ